VRGTIEAARKEASVTSDVLSRIEGSAAKLAAAHKAADQYLDGINDVLATSTDAFREAVVSTLNSVNRDFHTQLSTAVGLLGGAVQELEASLSSFAPQS
jgi:DNA-binding GntR family transcriptional regulator